MLTTKMIRLYTETIPKKGNKGCCRLGEGCFFLGVSDWMILGKLTRTGPAEKGNTIQKETTSISITTSGVAATPPLRNLASLISGW